jgi:hypothetical protein
MIHSSACSEFSLSWSNSSKGRIAKGDFTLAGGELARKAYWLRGGDVARACIWSRGWCCVGEFGYGLSWVDLKRADVCMKVEDVRGLKQA